MNIFSDFTGTDICYGTLNVDYVRESITLQDVANVYNETQHNYLSGVQLKKRITTSDDSSAIGEYHTIDTREWVEIDNHIIDTHRINVGRDYGNKETMVFIQIEEEGRTDKCKNYLQFHKKDWIEYRKERGDDKNKRPRSSKNGLIWVGDTTDVYKFRVFINKRDVSE